VITKKKKVAGKIGPAKQLKHGDCAWFQLSSFFYLAATVRFSAEFSNISLSECITPSAFVGQLHLFQQNLSADCNNPMLFNTHPGINR
jgi:hypothetical protein